MSKKYIADIIEIGTSATIAGNNILTTTSGYATTNYVDNAVAGLVDSAPTTLDTLNELATALGNDPNFAATVTNSIGLKWTQDNAKIANWDTAYGWGNHAGLYSLLGHTHDDRYYTETESDARFQPIGSYASASHNHDATYVNVGGDTMTGVLNIGNGSARIPLKLNSSSYPEIQFFRGGTEEIRVGSAEASSTYNNSAGDFYIYDVTSGQMRLRVPKDGSAITRNNGSITMIDSGNIGSQSVSYASSAGNASTLGGIALDSSSNSGTRVSVIPYIKSDSVMEVGKYIDMHTNPSSADYDIRLYADADVFTVSGGYTVMSTSARSPIFYDSNNTGYYADPSSSSKLYKLEMDNSHFLDKIKLFSGGAEWIGTSSSHLEIGGTNINFNGAYNTGVTTLKMNGATILSTGYNFLGNSFSASRRVTSPDGGTWTTTTSSWTGAIKIRLPHGWTNTMLRFTVKIYEYSTGKAFEVNVGGYNYSGSGGYWVNPSAYIVADPNTSRNFTVRFGYDSGYACVYIGETNSSWSYPQIHITDVQIGYQYLNVSDWDSGWQIGFVTSFGTISQTIANTQVGRIGDIWYDANNTGRYVNPSGLSEMGKIRFNDTVSQGTPTGDATIGRNYAYNTLELKGYGAEMMIGSQSTDIHINYRYCNGVGSNAYTPQTWYWRAGTSSSWSNHYWGLGQASSSLRAPIFYDSDNTNYYFNGAGTTSVTNINMNNGQLYGVGHITINDPGVNEGIEWSGGNGWKIFESPNTLTNAAGNLQFVRGSTRVATIDTSGFVCALHSSGTLYGHLSYYDVSFSNGSSFSDINFYVDSPYGEHFCYDTCNGNLYIGGSVQSNYYSDCKYKENITPIESALDKIDGIRGVEFDWNALGNEEIFKEGHEVGVIAQEVQAVYPQAVREVSKERDDRVVTALVVDHEKLIPLLLQGIKELKAVTSAQQIEIEELKNKVNGSSL